MVLGTTRVCCSGSKRRSQRRSGGPIPLTRSGNAGTVTSVPLWHAAKIHQSRSSIPHRTPTAQIDDDLVRVVDDEYPPAYWFPRDCPPATFWIGPTPHRPTPVDSTARRACTRASGGGSTSA